MSIAYHDVLKRLREERQRLSWTQQEMSQCVRMNQSNYSKVELGLRRLNYYELQYLCESGVDVYYIYTAHKSTGQYTNLFNHCSYAELRCFLGVIYAIARLGCRNVATDSWKNMLAQVQYVSLIAENNRHPNPFLDLRRSIHYQQKKMAQTLGVDVKKLRDLEKGRNLPDSELCCRLYELYHISPAVILQNHTCLVNEISILLDMMESEPRRAILDLLKIMHVQQEL